ncbi:MAG: glutamate 5-kinase [Desulfobacterales bacterium]
MNQDLKSCLSGARRVVIKVGSNVLTTNSGLNLGLINSLSRQISALMDRGLELIFVSSGAMASGIKKLGLPGRPEEIPKRQAVAAVGQAGLMMEYEKAFEQFDKKVAQILLTSDDLNHRRRYLNSRNTLNTLLSWKVVPIINENDTVMVEEIKLGDNDNLSAMITLLMDAHLLVNLTDIDGLFDRDPRKHSQARLLPEVSTIGKDIVKIAGDIPGTLGTGGMLSKVQAARKVTAAGIPMVIANGETPDILLRLFNGESLGTFFVPKKERLASRKCWIAFTLKPKGIIRIDGGAAEAILKNGKSLLPSGIIRVEGEFGVGAPVCLATDGQEPFGTGLVNYNSLEIRKIMGLKSNRIKDILGNKSYDEVIHRDNLVVII